MNYGWTLRKGSWDKLIAATNNRAWRSVAFSKFDKAQVPTDGGVYIFCVKPMKGSSDPRFRSLLNGVYVGQAVNLRKRFDDHLRKPMDPLRAVRACFSTTLEFWFTRVNSPEELCNLESLLIECLGPAANRQSGPTLKGRVGEAQPA